MGVLLKDLSSRSAEVHFKSVFFFCVVLTGNVSLSEHILIIKFNPSVCSKCEQ